MKRVLIYSLSLAFLSSCGYLEPVDVEAEKQELMNRDKSWSKKVGEVGFNAAMGEYYADEIVSLSSGKKPLIGKEMVESFMNEHPDTSTAFSWTPQKADVSKSGDLGYTWGKWKYAGKNKAEVDTVFYGVYATVWKKQEDGKWRAVLDQSNNTPKP